tara:strand:+ start:347 stop:598 length:252 start_codon:yes stop_codon:yes gene_type:complete
MSKTVNYDFSITNFVTVKAPYGVNPDTLLDQAADKLLSLNFEIQHTCGYSKVVHKNQIELHCENTYDQETGQYEPIPEDWYDK